MTHQTLDEIHDFRSPGDVFTEPKQSNFRAKSKPMSARKKVIKALRDSLALPAQKNTSSRAYHYAPIRGKFRVFKILHGQDIIFILDDPRCEELELRSVILNGLRGSTVCRIRSIGVVEGEIRSDAPVYQIDDKCLGLRRVNGNSKKANAKMKSL